ncbi:uncharacterized protein isoform X2 [Musca autumnalis]|uniref:uncharacterized protein isoform X2 n=1 Tax=Musca autumnalis TaxID=221902 RepID=UPI003CE78773
MDLNKRTKVTTKKQFDTMVQILQNNPNLARGYSNGIKKISVKEEWNKISTKLNILGPPVRTGWRVIVENVNNLQHPVFLQSITKQT